MVKYGRSHVDNPELILSTIAFHAIAALFGKWFVFLPIFYQPFSTFRHIFLFYPTMTQWYFRMKKVINGVASGPVNLVLCEILASFIFVTCIMEKGLWYVNVNENYFHVATAAQDCAQ